MEKTIVYENVRSHRRVSYRSGVITVPRPKAGYHNVHTYRNERALSHMTYPDYPGVFVISADDALFRDQIDYGPVARAGEKAAARFKAKCSGDRAEVGISVVQWKQSADMIVNRARTLVDFAGTVLQYYDDVRSGTRPKRRRALKILRSKVGAPVNSTEFNRLYRRSVYEWQRRVRTPGDLFLEFWFGWSPLVNDVYSAINIIQQPTPPTQKVRASATEVFNFSQYNNGIPATRSVSRGKASVGIFAHVSVTNPNAYLANKLGIINPATVALDAIPYSWLVGWFVNVKAMTDHLTWDVGLAFANTGWAYAWTAERDNNVYNALCPPSTAVRGRCDLSYKGRRQHLPIWVTELPALKFNAPVGSFARVGVALSMLSQNLSKLLK